MRNGLLGPRRKGGFGGLFSGIARSRAVSCGPLFAGAVVAVVLLSFSTEPQIRGEELTTQW